METATTMQQGLDLSTIGDFITKVGFPIAFILGICFLLYKVYTDILAPYFKKKLNSSIKKTSEDGELLRNTLTGRIDKQDLDITELKSEIKDIRTEQRKDKEDFLSAIKEVTTSFNKSLEKFDAIDSMRTEITDIKTDVESIKETVSKSTPKKTTAKKKPTVQK